jgi:hypothetical protein
MMDASTLRAERRPTVNDPEREDLLRRLDVSERARRRWKILALAGTPILAVLLIIAGANAVTSWFAMRDMAERVRAERERAMQAEEEARMEAEMARDQSERAMRDAEEVHGRAEKALKAEPPMAEEP